MLSTREVFGQYEMLNIQAMYLRLGKKNEDRHKVGRKDFSAEDSSKRVSLHREFAAVEVTLPAIERFTAAFIHLPRKIKGIIHQQTCA